MRERETQRREAEVSKIRNHGTRLMVTIPHESTFKRFYKITNLNYTSCMQYKHTHTHTLIYTPTYTHAWTHILTQKHTHKHILTYAHTSNNML